MALIIIRQKQPDSLSVIPGQPGKPLTWDITTVCLLVDSYVATAAQEAGSVAELAAAWKSAKYTNLDTGYTFQPTAIETPGSINNSARNFLGQNLGRKISLQSGNEREASFLFQQLSILIQRFTAILVHDSFVQEED